MDYVLVEAEPCVLHLLLLQSSFSRVQLFATLWSIACQAPLSMGFSRQEYWISHVSCFSCLMSHVSVLCFCFRELCTKLYSMSWGNTQSWQEFDRFCEYNPVEVSMLTCLADVREPCQLGCRNLTYCTNFNNR